MSERVSESECVREKARDKEDSPGGEVSWIMPNRESACEGGVGIEKDRGREEGGGRR
jgi:hypothetical protein